METVQKAGQAMDGVSKPAFAADAARALDLDPNQAMDGVPEPAFAPTVEVPKAGERFSDEELHARFGVPTRHGIRVNKENRCMVLVHLVGIHSGYMNTDRGTHILYMGENSDLEGLENQKMSGGNLALSRSMKDGYTVLYFIKEGNVLVFRSRVEYESHEYLIEVNSNDDPRVIVEYNLRTVRSGQAPSDTKTEMHVAGLRRAARDPDLEIVDSPPLTPSEIAAIKDSISDDDPRTLSKEEFLAIVTDSKKLKEHIQYMDSQIASEVV